MDARQDGCNAIQDGYETGWIQNSFDKGQGKLYGFGIFPPDDQSPIRSVRIQSGSEFIARIRTWQLVFTSVAEPKPVEPKLNF